MSFLTYDISVAYTSSSSMNLTSYIALCYANRFQTITNRGNYAMFTIFCYYIAANMEYTHYEYFWK